MVTSGENAPGQVGIRRGEQRLDVRGGLGFARAASDGRRGRGIEAMGLLDRGPNAPRRMYSCRRTLLFFVLAALIGWAGVFGAIYTTLVVLDLVAPPDLAQDATKLQEIAPASGK